MPISETVVTSCIIPIEETCRRIRKILPRVSALNPKLVDLMEFLEETHQLHTEAQRFRQTISAILRDNAANADAGKRSRHDD
jgi:hypothetical protein